MSSTSTSWSVQGNTKANGATTDGISNMTVSGDLTISGNKLTFGSGGIIEEETSSAALSFTGESYYSFTANTGQDLTFYLRADNNEDDADRWRLVFADGGQMTLANFSTGAYVQQLLLTAAGNLTTTGDLTVSGGDMYVGSNSNTQGALTLWDGDGGGKPGYIVLYSQNGTANYIFCEDDGTLKRHTAKPTANSDGDAIGGQTD